MALKESQQISKDGYKVFNRSQLQVEIEFNREKHKGMLIMGKPGMGKTYAIRSPRMISAYELAMQFQLNGIEAVNAMINNQIQYSNLTVKIDDLGTETEAKNFGTTLDVIPYVIQRIYDINQVAEKPIALWMTTNLNMTMLTERYGERVVDRIHEMCDIVVLNDSNLRR